MAADKGSVSALLGDGFDPANGFTPQQQAALKKFTKNRKIEFVTVKLKVIDVTENGLMKVRTSPLCDDATVMSQLNNQTLEVTLLKADDTATVIPFDNEKLTELSFTLKLKFPDPKMISNG